MTVNKVYCIQHVPFEGPGAIGVWAAKRDLPMHVFHAWEFQLPEPDPESLLLLMGGSMSANDDQALPWMAAEMAMIRQHLDAGGAALGICLGAQLLARVLGRTVNRGEQAEIGWFPLDLNPSAAAFSPLAGLPATDEVVHWHGECFSLPEGADSLASTPLCPCQAFLWDRRVLGLQFHLETTQSSLEALCEHCADELQQDVPSVQSAAEILSKTAGVSALNQHCHAVLDRFVAGLG